MKSESLLFSPEEVEQLKINGRKRSFGEVSQNIYPVVKVTDPYGHTRLIASMDPENEDIVWGFSDHGCGRVFLEDFSWSELQDAARSVGRPITKDERFLATETVFATCIRCDRVGQYSP